MDSIDHNNNSSPTKGLLIRLNYNSRSLCKFQDFNILIQHSVLSYKYIYIVRASFVRYTWKEFLGEEIYCSPIGVAAAAQKDNRKN